MLHEKFNLQINIIKRFSKIRALFNFAERPADTSPSPTCRCPPESLVIVSKTSITQTRTAYKYRRFGGLLLIFHIFLLSYFQLLQVNENSSLCQLLTNDANLEMLQLIGFRGNPFKATQEMKNPILRYIKFVKHELQLFKGIY